MENYDIALILRKKRQALGYTQKQVCELCNYEFSKQTLHRIETEKTTINSQTIQSLLTLYHQPSHTSCASIELENYNFFQMYNEILVLMVQKNYKEAERKLELLEQYIKEDAHTSKKYLEALKKELQYLNCEISMEDNDIVSFFQNLIQDIIPKEADLKIWPLTDMELNIFLTFFNILSVEKQYNTILPLLRSLLINIEQHYHNNQIFIDYHACFTCHLVRIIQKLNINESIEELIKTSLNYCITYGDISNTYRLQSYLLRYYEKNNFFENALLHKQCFQTAQNMYYLSITCHDEKKSKFFKNFLNRVYNYTELY